MAKLAVWGCLLLALGLAEVQAQTSVAEENETSPFADSGFTLLPDLPVKNQIPLLDNRFRIDDKVSEITLLLFRRRGSPSVILVRPDGTKLRFANAEEHNMRWHDAHSYDLIQIRDPMPGPWQAIGRLQPESRILVLTDIKLDADILPENLMAGETVKVTARLTSSGQPINARDFRDVLMLEVLFISTNKAEYDNFGRGVVQVAQFRDDGRGYDEKARDGVFTGEFQLNFAAGEWIPKYVVRTPLYTREVEQLPVLIHHAPVTVNVTPAPAAEGMHQVSFQVTDSRLVAASVLLQGRIRYPNGEVESFSLNEVTDGPRQLQVQNKGHGSYLLDISVFGETVDGREFVLNLPEESFLVNPVTRKAPALTELPQQIRDEISVEQSVIISEPEPEFPWMMVIAANLLILGGGSFAIWFVMTEKTLADLTFWQRKPAVQKDNNAVNNQTESVENKDSTVAGTRAKVQKNNDMDDILDLSLPDD
ncbi:TIGR03503 family protein [Chromatiaceae bacterium AAb-1]|nr:TIGR03503 family protein [Chromatiaceae bacterium AAb-1]